jgi:DNA-binding transcriptional MerR regulator
LGWWGEKNVDLLPIGKMAALNHTSVQTLRYYDIKQSAILDMIQYMKSLGMPLEQVKGQSEKEDIEEIQRILKKQIENIDEEIRKVPFAPADFFKLRARGRQFSPCCLHGKCLI